MLKQYSKLSVVYLLRPLAVSYGVILPVFSQVIFGLLALGLFLISSLFIYSFLRGFFIDSPGDYAGKLFKILIITILGYLVTEIGCLLEKMWHEQLVAIGRNILEFFRFLYAGLVAFPYDVSLAVLLFIVCAFCFISWKMYHLPPTKERSSHNSSINGLMPLLISVVQVSAVVGTLLSVNSLLLGVLLVITIKKTLLLYYLIFVLGLGITYLMQELLILKDRAHPVDLSTKLALTWSYIFICFALEGTIAKLIQFFT